MDLVEIGLDKLDRFDLAQDGLKWAALLNAVMNLPVP
jgi:hypothetical protein